MAGDAVDVDRASDAVGGGSLLRRRSSIGLGRGEGFLLWHDLPLPRQSALETVAARFVAMSDLDARLSVVANPSGWTVVGEIDAFSAPSLAAAFAELPDVARIVADFSGVTFMDSSGLRVLVDAVTAATDAGKALVIANPQSAIRRVVEISGLGDHLKFAD